MKPGKTQAAKRNTKAIGFNEAEYAEIVKHANAVGLIPRQYIMLKIRGTI
jgi:hypothetical protein